MIRTTLAAISLAGAVQCAGAGTLPTYTCVSLPDEGDGLGAAPAALNNRGEAVGGIWHSGDGFVYVYATRWRKQDQRAIPLVKHQAPSGARAIDDDGQIVGAFKGHPVKWVGRVMSWLPGPDGERTKGSAQAINRLGQIVGWHREGKAAVATMWHDDGMTALKPLAEAPYSAAHDINDLGTVVGESLVSDTGTETHAVQWEGGNPLDLGVLPGGGNSSANAVNSDGTIVGSSETVEYMSYHAVAWAQGRMIDLGVMPGHTRSTASDVNAAGAVVGGSNGDGIYRAVIWFDLTPGPIDLNGLVEAGGCRDESGLQWALSFAYAINDKGAIAAGAEAVGLDGRRRQGAFLLEPM